MVTCPSTNTAIAEQDSFWTGPFDAHRIGWIISGAAAAITCFLALISICGHARNYNRPLQQRQIIRILLLPPVYAVVSFFGYRYYRSFYYYELAEAGYEALALAAFLLLMLQYIGDSEADQKAIFAKKDKKPLPLPFCCFRYRPSKAYFTVALKWSVIQYVIIGPAISIAGIVTQYYKVYCPTSLSYHFARVYLVSVEFVSISIALYGLFVLYILVKEDLRGRSPLSKFMTIKVIVFLVFYQGFIFDILADYNVIKGTEYWTTTNIANGLNNLCLTLEMIIISAWQIQAFYWGEYRLENCSKPSGKPNKKGKTNIFMSILHALNFSDFLIELWHEIRFFFDRLRGKEYTRTDERFKFDFAQAFGSDEDDGFRGRPADLPLQLKKESSGSDPEMRQTNGAASGGFYQNNDRYSNGQHRGTSSADSTLRDHQFSDARDDTDPSPHQHAAPTIVLPSGPYGATQTEQPNSYGLPPEAQEYLASQDGSYTRNSLLAPQDGNMPQHGRPLSGYQSRPRSWEPQAM